MANPKIEVEIGAKTQGLRSGVNLAEKELNNLGRAAQQTSPKVNNLSQSISGANGVGIEFSRIIQDAPFGIIGVGNNITQLAGSFSNLQKQTGSSSQALKIAFQSIISPANLVVLGVSAVTTALTLYQMGAFGSKEATKDLREELDKFKETLDEARQAQLDGASSADKELVTINALRTVVENETLAREKRLAAARKLQDLSPEILGNLNQEKILAGQVGDSYEKITRTLLARATAESSIQRVVALKEEERLIREKIPEALQKLAKAEERVNKNRLAGQTELAVINENAVRFLKNQNPELVRLEEIEKERLRLIEQINNSLIDSGIELDNQVTKVSELESVINRINANPLQLVQPSQEQLLERLRARYQELQTGGIVEAPRTLSTAASNAPGITTELPIESIADTFVSNLERIEFKANELGQAFSGLGALIGKAFNNTGLGQFVGEFLRFASQLVAANFKISTANAITSATSSAAATGPGAIFTLPAFIAGAIGLVASAFAAIGGGSKSSIGSSGVGGASSQTFAGSGAGLDLNRSLALTGEFRINGRDLVYVIDESRSQNASG